ncbi:GroES-like protein [Hesseltinella vesiculosa]|uniref:GroES-like protein n=1 Tax=Hesseltinella vesiculosa TaxID=101127 RepID=A0A1X2GAN1_9FUNG|nr:GroES-like protein [Hesseltinella vesiculosa]
MSEDTFHGWAVFNKGEPMVWTELPLKKWEDSDVELNVTHCGVCGSDVHTMDSGWEPTNYPCVTGHEITGIVTRVGSKVTKFKVGDRAGVGAQSGACLDCDNCKAGLENMCRGIKTSTYDSHWPNGDKSYGGYATKWRGHQHLVFKIPESMTNERAACMLCAGLTTYAPLKRYNVTKGAKVGVKGLGGLGHFAVLWAKAMGAYTVALSTSDSKRDDAKRLGCDEYLVMSDKEALADNANTFTHIIDCAYPERNDFKSLFRLLKANSTYILVGLPEVPLQIPAMALASNQVTLVGSLVGSVTEMEDMLAFAEEHNVQPWLNKYKMSDAPAAVEAFRQGKARYRIILEA